MGQSGYCGLFLWPSWTSPPANASTHVMGSMATLPAWILTYPRQWPCLMSALTHRENLFKMSMVIWHHWSWLWPLGLLPLIFPLAVIYTEDTLL